MMCSIARVGALSLALLLSGCATHFSPGMVREEIVRQSGEDPLSALELNLSRFTTLLLKSALAGGSGEIPFAGLSSLQLAVYTVPRGEGPAIDVTKIAVRGWEPVVRTYDSTRSGMLLIRPRGDAIGQLVVVGAGPEKVVYGRLTGVLSRDLPEALGNVLERGGPDALQRALNELNPGG